MHLSVETMSRVVGTEIIQCLFSHIAFGVVASAPILLMLCVVIYRVTIHPLARYPGPFLAKITDAYAGYHGWAGDIHLDVHRLHKKHGTFVRYGPNRLLVNSARGLRDIYSHGKNVQKSKTYLPMVPRKHAWSTLTTIDKHHHRFKRGLLSSQLRPQNLEQFEPMLLHYVDIVCAKLSEGSTSQNESEPRNMAQWCELFTLDVIGSFAFGQKLGMLDNSENRFIMNTLHRYSQTMGVYLQMPSLSKLKLEQILGVLTAWTKSQRAQMKWTTAFAAKVLSTTGGREKGFFSHIVAARDREGNQFEFEELLAEGAFLLLAGFETSATTLGAIFFYLAHCPRAYHRLEEEIQRTFPDPSEICTGPKLMSCVYLNACITEAMRMSPATPGFPLREVLSPGTVVDGQDIPPGIDVGSCIYALHHNPKYFENPDAFIPERWIGVGVVGDDNNCEERLAMQFKVYSPFSIGPRSCPGRQFAMMEMSLLLARVISTLKFQLAEDVGSCIEGVASGIHSGDGEGGYQLRAHVTSSGHGPLLTFRKRA